MMTCSIAVDVARSDEEQDTEWFSVVSFGRASEQLARHVKGYLVAFMGQLCRMHFVGHDRQDCASWSLTAESLVSARTVRLSGRRVSSRAEPRQPGNSSSTTMPTDSVDDLYSSG
jgi:single-strand DNA-binding protein